MVSTSQSHTAVVRAEPGSEPGATHLWTMLPATASAVTSARRMLADWLRALGWPEAESDDIVLAVNEALANVVDHAYQEIHPRQDGSTGQAQLYAWVVADGPESQERRIVAVVIDYGRWKPFAIDPGYRGRGLAMMTACMESVRIDPSPGGTTVIMTSTPVRGASEPNLRPVTG